MGPGRFAKSSERLREGRKPARGLAFTAVEGKRLIGTIRLWPVTAGAAGGCLLLGPLAVAADVQGCGVGADLMWRALREAKRRGYRAVLLVGDPAYYRRFGFSAENTGALRMPGPYERERLLAHEFVTGTVSDARGMIAADRAHRRGLRAYFVSEAPVREPESRLFGGSQYRIGRSEMSRKADISQVL